MNHCHFIQSLSIGELVWFHSEKGNMQGNPISPYIFIICIEHLDRYIHFMSTQRNFGIGIKLTKDFPNISYIIFADDCLFFYRTTKKAVKTIGDIL